MQSLLEKLEPIDRLKVLERLLGMTLCAQFHPDHEDDILSELARRIKAVNRKIRAELQQERAPIESKDDPETRH